MHQCYLKPFTNDFGDQNQQLDFQWYCCYIASLCGNGKGFHFPYIGNFCALYWQFNVCLFIWLVAMIGLFPNTTLTVRAGHHQIKLDWKLIHVFIQLLELP